MSYTYDAASRRTGMTVAGQPAVAYTYDNGDRLTQVTQGTSTVAVAYDAANRRTSLTLPNGILVEYAYDTASRLTGLTYKLGQTTLGTLTYTYDAAGSRTQVGGTWARTGLPDPISAATYNAANQQLVLGPKTMSYDLNGNLMTLTDTGGTTTYTWDARNRLTGLSGPGLTASFGYDGLGRRWTKTVNAARTDFRYDGLNPVQEGVLPSNPAANLLTALGIDEYFTRTDAAGTRALLTDALGSTIALTDNAGTVATEYTYEPFGDATVTGTPNSSTFQFTGRESDGTGLYYYRARYYHPGLQRFISEDPIELAGGDVNLYAYVWNDPLNNVDPWGLWGGLVLGGRGGAYVRPNPNTSLPPSRNFNPPLRPIRPTPNAPLRPGPAEPPPGRPGLDPHYEPAGHRHPWPGPGPCWEIPCIGPGAIGPIGPAGGPPPGGGRKDPPPPPPLPPPCPPLDQMMGLCAPPQT